MPNYEFTDFSGGMKTNKTPIELKPDEVKLAQGCDLRVPGIVRAMWSYETIYGNLGIKQIYPTSIFGTEELYQRRSSGGYSQLWRDSELLLEEQYDSEWSFREYSGNLIILTGEKNWKLNKEGIEGTFVISYCYGWEQYEILSSEVSASPFFPSRSTVFVAPGLAELPNPYSCAFVWEGQQLRSETVTPGSSCSTSSADGVTQSIFSPLEIGYATPEEDTTTVSVCYTWEEAIWKEFVSTFSVLDNQLIIGNIAQDYAAGNWAASLGNYGLVSSVANNNFYLGHPATAGFATVRRTFSTIKDTADIFEVHMHFDYSWEAGPELGYAEWLFAFPPMKIMLRSQARGAAELYLYTDENTRLTLPVGSDLLTYFKIRGRVVSGGCIASIYARGYGDAEYTPIIENRLITTEVNLWEKPYIEVRGYDSGSSQHYIYNYGPIMLQWAETEEISARLITTALVDSTMRGIFSWEEEQGETSIASTVKAFMVETGAKYYTKNYSDEYGFVPYYISFGTSLFYSTATFFGAGIGIGTKLHNLPSSSNPGVSKLWIWRFPSTGSALRLVGTVANGTTTFSDTLTDIELGELYEEGHDKPGAAIDAVAHRGKLYYLLSPNLLYWPDTDWEWEYLPATNYVALGDGSNPALRLLPLGYELCAYNQIEVWKFLGSVEEEYELRRAHSNRGIMNANTLASEGQLHFFVDPKGSGIFGFDSVRDILISLDVEQNFLPQSSAEILLDTENPTYWSLCFSNGILFLCADEAYVLEYLPVWKQWSSLGQAYRLLSYNPVSGNLYGITGAAVHRLQQPGYNGATIIPWQLKTKHYAREFGELMRRKGFGKIKFFLDPKNGVITISSYVDGTLIQTWTYSSAGEVVEVQRTTVETTGYYFSLTISGTEDSEFYGFMLDVRPNKE